MKQIKSLADITNWLNSNGRKYIIKVCENLSRVDIEIIGDIGVGEIQIFSDGSIEVDGDSVKSVDDLYLFMV